MKCADCDNPSHARGLCRAHYWKAMRDPSAAPPKTKERAPVFCTIPGCEKKTQYRGKLCPMHMMRLYRTGSTDARQYMNKMPCTGPECSRRARHKGLCAGHASQVRRGAELRPIGKPKVSYKVGRPLGGGARCEDFPDRESSRKDYARCKCGLMLPCVHTSIDEYASARMEWT